MNVLEEKWREIEERLKAAYGEAVAKEIVAKAQAEAGIQRRAKDIFFWTTGRRAGRLEEPLLKAAAVLMAEGLVQSYGEAFERLGVQKAAGAEAAPEGEGEAEEAAPLAEAGGAEEGPEASSPEGEHGAAQAVEREPLPQEEQSLEAKPSLGEGGSMGQAPNRMRRKPGNQEKWQAAYRRVYGTDPRSDPLYPERLRKAVLLFRPEKGREAAFRELKEAEEKLSQTKQYLPDPLELLEEAEAQGPGAPGGGWEMALVQLGRLTALVEELERKVRHLEEAVQREATRYGGTKAGLLSLNGQIRELREEVKALKEAVDGRGGADTRAVESLVRAAKAEVLAETEKRISYATDLWRSEMEPRLRALEEWAKRITEAFRRVMEARERKGLFGLLGGDRR